MKLRTLGGLSVAGSPLKREKVLLLLAYLCLEGQQPRKRLSEIFWPDASNPMNSLAQHLVHLRSLPGAVQEDGSRVTATIPCDAVLLREAARKGQLQEAADLYQGAFLDGLTIPLGAELEEWVFETREQLALETRSVLITLGSQQAARGYTSTASDLAARALTLSGAPPADEVELPKLWYLLQLAGHPLAGQVEREARELGLTLEAVPSAPTTPFVGREQELARLSHLPPGSVAWISGHAGMGKTALLEALARSGGWQVLPARQDLPFGTLAPLARTPITSLQAALHALRDPKLRIAIDDWETTDQATREVIAQAARLKPGAVIVIACRRQPPFDVELHLPLGALTPQELREYPDLHARTDGHPTLVGAALRGQPLDVKQGARVRALPALVRDAYLLLALQDDPDLRATRLALNMSADEFAQTLSRLTQEGLTLEGGRVYAARSAREYLNQVPVYARLLHLKLARALPQEHAWPHYDLSRDLWEEQDESRVIQAASHRATDLMKRGYPGEAVTILDAFSDQPELALTHTWALLGTGRFIEALSRVESLPAPLNTTAQALVARASALVRLGRHEEAVALAAQVGGSGPEAARAASVLAHAARIREHWEEARRHSQIAADLWQLNGDEEERLTELAHAARCQVRLGAAPDRAFREVLEHSRGLPSVHGMVLVNYAQVLLDAGQGDLADSVMEQALTELTEAGDKLGLASALGNLGVRRHQQGRLKEAAELYRDALDLLKGTGNIRHLGLTLSNLSEIEGDLSAFEDTLQMLANAGQHELVAHIRRNAKIVPPLKSKPLRS